MKWKKKKKSRPEAATSVGSEGAGDRNYGEPLAWGHPYPLSLSIRFYPSSSNRVPAPYAASTDHTEQQQEESVRFLGKSRPEGILKAKGFLLLLQQRIYSRSSCCSQSLCFYASQYFSDAHLLFRSFLSPLIHSCPQVPQSTGSQSWPNRSSIYTNCTSWSWNGEDWSKW